jgi:two-component system KDP operon response regulator KdpE
MSEPPQSHSMSGSEQNDLLISQDAGRTRVLVVDGDGDTKDSLMLALEPKSFEIISANSGEEFSELVVQSAPDVIVVDLTMPGMDGLRVLRSIRQFSNIPILILSAVNKPNMTELALDGGADDFIYKPLSNGMLVASINNLARRARAVQRSLENNPGGP